MLGEREAIDDHAQTLDVGLDAHLVEPVGLNRLLQE